MSARFAAGERARPDWLREHPRAWLAAVITVCFGAFMGQLDASVVTLTYRSIGSSFHAGLASVQWISLTYLITLAALLVPVGRASDRIGRKRVYLWGFGLFTLASAACAAAPTLAALAAVRAVQGVGAAMLQANSVALVATSAPAHRLRMALGLQAAAQAIGLALGPTIGGLLVQTVGWRWVFAVNVPVGIVAIVAGRYLLPRTRVTGPAGGGLREALHLPGVSRGLVGAMFAYLLLFGPIVLVPALVQAHGMSPLHAGLLVAALPTGFAIGAVLSERALPAAWGPARRCRFGLLATGVGLAALLLSGIHPIQCLGSLAVTGVGLGVFTPTNNALIMHAVPARIAALTGGLVSTGRALGTATGTVLVAVALTANGSGVIALAGLLLITALTAGTLVNRRPN